MADMRQISQVIEDANSEEEDQSNVQAQSQKVQIVYQAPPKVKTNDVQCQTDKQKEPEKPVPQDCKNCEALKALKENFKQQVEDLASENQELVKQIEQLKAENKKQKE